MIYLSFDAECYNFTYTQSAMKVIAKSEVWLIINIKLTYKLYYQYYLYIYVYLLFI